MNSGNVVDMADEIEHNLWPGADGAMMFKAAHQEELYYVHGYLLEDEEGFLDGLEQVNKKQEEFLGEIKESEIFDEEYSKLKQLDVQMDAAVSKIVAAHQAGNEQKVEKIMEEELDPAAEEITSLTNSMDEKIDKQMSGSAEALHVTSTDTKTMAMGATIVAAVAGFGIAIFTSNTISRNVNEVAQVAQRIGKGEHSARSEVKSEDEIGQLAESVNKMGESIESNVKEIEAKQKEVQSVVDGIEAPVMKIDKEFNIKMLNKAGAEVVGKTPEEAIGMKCYNLFKTPHCNTEECRCKQAMQYNEARKGETVAKPLGKEIPIMYVGTPLFDENGEVEGVVEYVVDLTEIKKKEKEIQQVLDGVEAPIMKIDKDFNIVMLSKVGAEDS